MTVYLKVKEENKDSFLQHAQSMITDSNLEKGCITYRLLQDINDSSTFVFYEEYINQEAMDFHTQTAHYHAFLSTVTPFLVEEPVINLF